jgi:hypothetical protein
MHLTEPHKVLAVRLDRQGISENSLPVECVELSAPELERGSQTPLPCLSASSNTATCLLCSLGACCANDRSSLDGTFRVNLSTVIVALFRGYSGRCSESPPSSSVILAAAHNIQWATKESMTGKDDKSVWSRSRFMWRKRRWITSCDDMLSGEF